MAEYHRLPVVLVVFDGGGFGNVRRIHARQYGNRLIASDQTQIALTVIKSILIQFCRDQQFTPH